MLKNSSSKPKIRFVDALGIMTLLSLQSPFHRKWRLSDIDTNFIPALKSGNCKIYFDINGQPQAFVTWALVDEETHFKIKQDGITPPEPKWKSGNFLWFIDAIAPYGNASMIIRDMRTNHFSGHHGYSIKRNGDGSIKRIKLWRNTR